MNWLEDRWHSMATMGSDTWLAWALWLALVVGVVVLIDVRRQIRRNRRTSTEQTRPHVAMFMEPNTTDWHVLELVVRNFGQTAAYDVEFEFPRPPSVARYETTTNGYADVVSLQLPRELPKLAPGQEWRTVWDSAIDRAELGSAIDSRFTGSVMYYDHPEHARRWWQPRREQFRTKVVLDWNELPPVQRLELMTTHDLAKREKEKLELLRSLLTYFHYVSAETHPDVVRSEIERTNRVTKEIQDRWHSNQSEDPTGAIGRRSGTEPEPSKGRG